MTEAGIVDKKDSFIQKCRRFASKVTDAAVEECQLSENTSSLGAVSAFLVSKKILLNKNEMENLYIHYGAGDSVDLIGFFQDISVDLSGRNPFYLETMHDDPNAAHLALSGVSHVEYGVQYKPFPAHWGKPPNCQMKGHSGVMRDLPGGYGKGNEPMAKWVGQNLVKDKETLTNERGVKPFPFGNYSLGSTVNM